MSTADQPSRTPEAAVAHLAELYERSKTQDYIGEAVSQHAHSLQAAWWADKQGASDEVVLAALLHDIGHIAEPEAAHMGAYGVENHDALGGEYLRRLGFSETVCRLVAGHVQAKRYLTATNARYHANLSPASQATLTYQGGPMSPQEVQAFEADPLFKLHLQMRSWDEQAKVEGQEVPDFDHYAPRMLAHLQAQTSD